MDFGAITAAVKEATLEQKLDHLKAWRMSVWHPAAGEVAKEDPTRIKAMTAERGLGMSALSAGVPMADPSKKEANLKEWDVRVKNAAAIGVKIVVSRTFAKPEGLSDDDAWKTVISLGREMAKRCADSGCFFALETDHFNFIENLAGAKRLLAEIAHPAMKINYDPCNYYFGGNDPIEVMDALFPHIVHGHIKDAVRVPGEKTKEAAVGKGDLNYVQILGELNRRGFKGAMCIEHCKSFDEIEAAWKHIQSVRAKLGL